MLFRKKIEPACTYCVHGTRLDEEKILCSRKGIQDCDDHCFRFKYDPTKRVPLKAKALDFSRYSEEDFAL